MVRHTSHDKSWIGDVTLPNPMTTCLEDHMGQDTRANLIYQIAFMIQGSWNILWIGLYIISEMIYSIYNYAAENGQLFH